LFAAPRYGTPEPVGAGRGHVDAQAPGAARNDAGRDTECPAARVHSRRYVRRFVRETTADARRAAIIAPVESGASMKASAEACAVCHEPIRRIVGPAADPAQHD
jgi:hypothetical protein